VIAVLYDVHGSLQALDAVLAAARAAGASPGCSAATARCSAGALERLRVEYDTAATIAKLREAYGEREWAPTLLKRLETQQPWRW
jgi:hypothetical protein